jgi:hypothetical protein
MCYEYKKNRKLMERNHERVRDRDEEGTDKQRCLLLSLQWSLAPPFSPWVVSSF